MGLKRAFYTLWASQIYKEQLCQTEGNTKGRTHERHLKGKHVLSDRQDRYTKGSNGKRWVSQRAEHMANLQNILTAQKAM